MGKSIVGVIGGSGLYQMEGLKKRLGPGDSYKSLLDAVSGLDAKLIAVRDPLINLKISANEEWALFEEFKAHGGRGVEVQTASHGDADVAKYSALARERGLLASRGSDFHSPDESRIELGALPPLPAGLTPVWSELRSRVARAV